MPHCVGWAGLLPPYLPLGSLWEVAPPTPHSISGRAEQRGGSSEGPGSEPHPTVLWGGHRSQGVPEAEPEAHSQAGTKPDGSNWHRGLGAQLLPRGQGVHETPRTTPPPKAQVGQLSSQAEGRWPVCTSAVCLEHPFSLKTLDPFFPGPLCHHGNTQASLRDRASLWWHKAPLRGSGGSAPGSLWPVSLWGARRGSSAQPPPREPRKMKQESLVVRG